MGDDGLLPATFQVSFLLASCHVWLARVIGLSTSAAPFLRRCLAVSLNLYSSCLFNRCLLLVALCPTSLPAHGRALCVRVLLLAACWVVCAAACVACAALSECLLLFRSPPCCVAWELANLRATLREFRIVCAEKVVLVRSCARIRCST